MVNRRRDLRVLELAIETVSSSRLFVAEDDLTKSTVQRYRLFGDLTTAALRAGFRLPSMRPPPTPIPTPGVPQPPSPGLMPLNVLQHPGHYYFLSAVCALERRERYRTIKSHLETNGNGLGDKPPEGALLHEGKVDHTEIIIEVSKIRSSRNQKLS